MHIFQRHRPVKFAALDFALYLVQAVNNRIALIIGKHAYPSKHGGVGNGTLDVLGARRWSKLTDAVKRATKASVGSLKRPPQD
ncbi:hypothetical protein HORIV_69970 [Vreelandella olivaria]|uniref:Uncharacterized protein n=1 Tax=Vreelandella olivaria TaxID=390919 RepID=A0ABM7GUY2_9GAMM|nr:hypothetical protein HORIV_69970 [Halomonas olivaria]